MYSKHRLALSDNYTLNGPAEGITYILFPKGWEPIMRLDHYRSPQLSKKPGIKMVVRQLTTQPEEEIYHPAYWFADKPALWSIVAANEDH